MKWMRGLGGLLLISGSLIGSSCGDSPALEPVPGADEFQEAEEIVRGYLAAAAADDGRRLCALRTVREVRRLGGRARCQRRLTRSAFDGGPEPKAVERGEAKILRADTRDGNGHIVVWADAGEARFESGHPKGGTVVIARVYEKDGRLRIGTIGEATFAD